MIFSGLARDGRKHIDLIFLGFKTVTRRPTARYMTGRTYAVQPKRCAPADPRGRIRILSKYYEARQSPDLPITSVSARAEGGYTPDEYEAVYRYLYPKWEGRWVYEFEAVPCSAP